MDKQQIRDKLIDWWIPNICIDQLEFAYNDLDDRVDIYEQARNGTLLIGGADVWFRSIVQHDHWNIWFDAALNNIQDRDFDSIDLQREAYFLWFIDKYELLLDEDNDTLVE